MKISQISRTVCFLVALNLACAVNAGEETRKESQLEGPIAFPILFDGAGPYMKAFEGSGYGVVFEDDGETGYFYATDEAHESILDALQLYDYGDAIQLQPGDEIYIVWHPELEKAGIFFGERFHAVFDFRNKKACCRTDLPPATPGWVTGSHDWDPSMIAGLESE
jgi:hypothetical protein